MPAVASDYDTWLAQYVEFLWLEGESKNAASSTLAAVQYYVPQLRKQLPLSWKLKSAWDNLELPCQAAPLTPVLLFAFVHEAFVHDWKAFAWLCVIMFLGFLRPGEALSLLVRDVCVSTAGVSLTLRDTESSQRLHQIRFEELLLEDPLAIHAARCLMHNKKPGDLFGGLSTYMFRKQWFHMISHFALHGQKFQPYSLRRGGATHDFHVSGNLQRTMLLGRWKHTSTAKLYLKEARAAVHTVRFAGSQRDKLVQSATMGRRWLQRRVGTHGRLPQTDSYG